eukprot:c9026_g1_i1 orf=62-232(+)
MVIAQSSQIADFPVGCQGSILITNAGTILLEGVQVCVGGFKLDCFEQWTPDTANEI